jgi:hypothetical protein
LGTLLIISSVKVLTLGLGVVGGGNIYDQKIRVLTKIVSLNQLTFGVTLSLLELLIPTKNLNCNTSPTEYNSHFPTMYYFKIHSNSCQALFNLIDNDNVLLFSVVMSNIYFFVFFILLVTFSNLVRHKAFLGVDIHALAWITIPGIDVHRWAWTFFF